MKIHQCHFIINHQKVGVIYGTYRYPEGDVVFSGTCKPGERWKGSGYYSKEDQAVYLDLLEDAVKIQGDLFA